MIERFVFFITFIYNYYGEVIKKWINC